MSASSLYQADYIAEQLRGLKKPWTSGSPSDRWTHSSGYVLMSILAFFACVVLSFFLFLPIEIRHFGEPGHTTSWTTYWAMVAVGSCLSLVVVWVRAWIVIRASLGLQRRFNCTYRDAYFVRKRARLRRIAGTLTLPQEFQELVRQARRVDTLTAYLLELEKALKVLESQQNDYAEQVRKLAAKQRAEILALTKSP